MRLKEVLSEIDDVAILYKYLYIDPNNFIRFSNGVTELEIHMTDNCNIMCKNLSFPHLLESNFSETLTLGYALALVSLLKVTPPEEYPDRFVSRWDEIKTITQANCALNYNL